VQHILKYKNVEERYFALLINKKNIFKKFFDSIINIKLLMQALRIRKRV